MLQIKSSEQLKQWGWGGGSWARTYHLRCCRIPPLRHHPNRTLQLEDPAMDSEAFAAVLIAAVLSLFLWSRQQQQSEEEPIGMRNRARQETEARVFFLEENLETS